MTPLRFVSRLMARSLIEEEYTWSVRAVLLGAGSVRDTSYQIHRLTTLAIAAPGA